MSGSGACRDNLDNWLDDAEIDAPAPQETPAQQEPRFDKSGLKEACERGLALGRTRQEFDLQLLLDMLLEIERLENRDPAFQKLVKTLDDLCGFLNVTPLRLNEGDSMTLSMLTDSAREALRLARQGEGEIDERGK